MPAGSHFEKKGCVHMHTHTPLFLFPLRTPQMRRKGGRGGPNMFFFCLCVVVEGGEGDLNFTLCSWCTEISILPSFSIFHAPASKHQRKRINCVPDEIRATIFLEIFFLPLFAAG